MGKIDFYTLDKTEKQSIFQAISAQTGMPAFAVEKDWWVTQALAIVFEMDVSKHVVFKGGTSLSKAWKLIQRFSEDIDLAIDSEYFAIKGALTRSKITQLRKTAGAYSTGIFFDELQKRFADAGFHDLRFIIAEAKDSDQDPIIIEIHYPNIIEAPGYLLPRIQIEIGCRSLREPFTVQAFGSLVDEIYKDKEFSKPLIHVPTVNPERTFLEKIFLLHEEFHRPAEKMRVDKLSRHLYDVYHLSKTPFAEKAINNQELYETIVAHRYKFSRVGGVDYNEHDPRLINPIPVPEVMEAWKADYKRMLEEMIYEPDAPSFEQLIEKLNEQISRLKAVSWKFSNEFPKPNS